VILQYQFGIDDVHIVCSSQCIHTYDMLLMNSAFMLTGLLHWMLTFSLTWF